MVISTTLNQQRDISSLPERCLYEALIQQSRSPSFYRGGAISDTVDGRFDWLACHVALLLIRLNAESASGFSQRLYDLFVADMERWAREAGVGDLSVGRHVKACVTAFQGRLFAYHEALTGQEESLLQEAIVRNVYRGSPPAPELVKDVETYLRDAFQRLRSYPLEDIQTRPIPWPDFPGSKFPSDPSQTTT